ncbi:hypothetical protein FCL47_01015 [Desulfopila sp. IMCC35006]|uniref:hypothetical protein n=1 Tax=Desulfopila sp. IMCC35006 TaxID=2569542 RepID=UPI0010AC46C7|nr:hypothetical protein [Desulfopila sp. IMCC35006]TKB28102.1 hypothetical protein FCL47_01015 [Desulfopila sp. IMCC35006]
MFLSQQSIPLEAISPTIAEWNLHPWECRILPEELHASLASCGILHPPLVIADSTRTFAVVSGVRRIEFIRQFSPLSQVNCLVIDKNAPHNFILDLLLVEQNSAGPLSLAEKARFIEIACRLSVPEEVMRDFQKKLQLKGGRSTIPNLLKILDQDESIIQDIHAGRIQDRMVTELLSLPKNGDRLAMALLFRNLRMGDGQQRKFFNLIRDIACREGVSISAFLQKSDVVEILEHTMMNIPQKIQHLGNMLQHAVAPTSALAEEAFALQIKGLQLPSSYTVSHSPFFEKDDVTLSITFKNLADCIRYLNQEQN